MKKILMGRKVLLFNKLYKLCGLAVVCQNGKIAGFELEGLSWQRK